MEAQLLRALPEKSGSTTMEPETQFAFEIEYNPASYTACAEGSALGAQCACSLALMLLAFKLTQCQHDASAILITLKVATGRSWPLKQIRS